MCSPFTAAIAVIAACMGTVEPRFPTRKERTGVQIAASCMAFQRELKGERKFEMEPTQGLDGRRGMEWRGTWAPINQLSPLRTLLPELQLQLLLSPTELGEIQALLLLEARRRGIASPRTRTVPPILELLRI